MRRASRTSAPRNKNGRAPKERKAPDSGPSAALGLHRRDQGQPEPTSDGSKVLRFDPWAVRSRNIRSLDRLVLGCGRSPVHSSVNLDIVAGPHVDLVTDATHTPWRWPEGDVIPDNHFAHIETHHTLEHIPHQVWLGPEKGFHPLDGLTLVFNEVWRVLQPGGTFLVSVPSARSFRAFQDPTHTRYFTSMTFVYYARPKDRSEEDWKHWYGADYGIESEFVIEQIGEAPSPTFDLTCLMVKPDLPEEPEQPDA